MTLEIATSHFAGPTTSHFKEQCTMEWLRNKHQRLTVPRNVSLCASTSAQKTIKLAKSPSLNELNTLLPARGQVLKKKKKKKNHLANMLPNIKGGHAVRGKSTGPPLGSHTWSLIEEQVHRLPLEGKQITRSCPQLPLRPGQSAGRSVWRHLGVVGRR